MPAWPRRIVSAAFNPRMIKSIEDRIEFQANDVINWVADQGGRDFVVEGGGAPAARDHLRHDGQSRRLMTTPCSACST